MGPGHGALDGTKVEANASMHKAEILDAREDRCYGKGNLGSDLPDGLRRRQDRLARIRQAGKEMAAATAAAAARQRQQKVDEAKAKADAAREANAPPAAQAELDRKAETAADRCPGGAWREGPTPPQQARARATSLTPTAIS